MSAHRLILAVGLLASLASASAQTVRAELALRRVEGSVVEQELRLTLTIADRWHIYGRTGGSGGEEPLALTPELPPGVEAVGEWSWPPAKRQDAAEVYYGKQVFRQKVRVAKLSAPKKILVRIGFQACSAEVCEPPEEIEAVVVVGR